MPERGLEQVDMAAAAHRYHHLRQLAQETSDDQVQAILILAAAVLLHGEVEPAHLGPVLRFVDPGVVHELALEHDRLAKDVAYLHEVRRNDPESADIPVLAAAIRRHLLAHLERDERILYQPMQRLVEGLDSR